jgi:hypothetical protein
MKKLIVSMFMSAMLICGMNAMAQNASSTSKTPEKTKTEVKADASKKAEKKSKCAKAEKKSKTAETTTKSVKK